MIKIKSKLVKKTKAYITYEFSSGEEVITKTYSMSAKVFWELSDRDLFNRIRAQVLKQRIKLGKPRPQLEEPEEIQEYPEAETETEE
ncbi:MAG: hypothetical protein ACTSWQ_00100 [Candidatus Thorarchaeota archaeon]